MNEESQIDEMRAALRGDRERAERARLRSAENVGALTETPAGDPCRSGKSRLQACFGRLFGRRGTAITRLSASGATVTADSTRRGCSNGSRREQRDEAERGRE